MKEFLEQILKKIANQPEKVSVDESEDEIGKIMIINTAEEDKAIVIGKGGRNINALRTISTIFSKRDGERVYIKVAE